MKIAVIAATGRAGELLVEELLRRGHELAVLVRTPDKLGPLADRVRVVQGPSTDRAALDQLLVHADAVVSSLGPTEREPDLHTRTAHALIDAMHAQGVRRFVGISGAGTARQLVTTSTARTCREDPPRSAAPTSPCSWPIWSSRAATHAKPRS